MFEKFFGKKEEDGKKRAGEITIELGGFLDLTRDDREEVSSGEKLDFDDRSKALYTEGRGLIEFGKLDVETASDLKNVLDAIEETYKV